MLEGPSTFTDDLRVLYRHFSIFINPEMPPGVSEWMDQTMASSPKAKGSLQVNISMFKQFKEYVYQYSNLLA